MSNIFQITKNPSVPRNRFDLSHDHKFTCDIGQLIPVLLLETFPGDQWNIRAEVLTRTLALLSPVMHLVEIDLHYYKVPIEILYPDFNDIIAPPDPNDTPPVTPYFANVSDIDSGDVGDYLGLPIDSDAAIQNFQVVAYPVAAYAKIYDYWYRDQNLQAEVFEPLTGGQNNWAFNVANNPPVDRDWETTT